MNQWFVYQGEGSHVGPVTTDLLVRGIAAGRVPKDAHVAKAGSNEWKPLMTISEVVIALEALDDEEGPPPASIGLEAIAIAPSPPPPPEPPGSEADATEVHRRDEAMKLALAKARPVSVAPPKPPTPPTAARASNPPPLRPSGSMAIAPSKSAIPAAAPVAAAPAVPPPPNTLKTLSHEPSNGQHHVPSSPPQPPPQMSSSPPLPLPMPPQMSSSPPPPPPQMSSSPPPPLPAPPAMADAQAHGAPSNAPTPLVTEAAPPPKDEPKKPLVDPKLALLIPFGIFAAFAFLSLIVVVYALVFKPKPISAESSGASEPASAVTQP